MPEPVKPNESNQSDKEVWLDPVNASKSETKFLNALIFFSLGVSNLIPWFALWNIIENLKSQLSSEPTLLKFLIPSIAISSMGGVLAGNLINITVLYRVKQLYRVLVPLFVYFVAFIIIMISFLTVLRGSPLFLLIIFLAFIMNISSPIMISALYEDASIFGMYCFTSVNTGQSFGGVIIALILISITATKISVNNATTLFLAVILSIIVLCFILYIILIVSKKYKESLETKEDVKIARKSLSEQFNSLREIFKSHYIVAMSIYLDLAISLMIFPGFLYRIQPVTYVNLQDGLFSSILVQFCFNFGDFVGRYLNLFVKWPKHSSYLLILMTVLRLGFLPIFMMFDLGANKIFNFVLFKHDFFGFIITFLFGVTNSHIITVVFSSTYTLSNKENQQNLSKLLVLMLGMGLCTGSALSFIFAT